MTSYQGMLTIWTDVTPDAEEDFNNWYNREHLYERAAIPGFFNARRYSAVTGSPAYMALYDTENSALFNGPEYKAVLDAATPWTKRIMPEFRGTTRCVSDQIFQFGQGWTPYALSLRLYLGEDAQRAVRVATTFKESILPPLTEDPGIGGVFLMRPVPTDGGPIPSDAAVSGRSVSLFLHVAITHKGVADTLLRGALSTSALEELGIEPAECDTGLYQFISGVDAAVTARTPYHTL